VVSHTWNGTHVTYTPGSPFSDGQVVNVELNASDNVGNAMAEYSWSFTVDIHAPVASNEVPANGIYVSDSTPTIIVALSDNVSGIDSSTIVLNVEGSPVSHTWNGTHVSYTPGTPFSDGQVVNINLDASDNAGNVMTTYSWSFTIDTSSPAASNPKPANGSYTNSTMPTIIIALSDSGSGVNGSSISLAVEGTVVSHTWNGTHITYTPGSPFSNGQVVNVELNASDNVGNAMSEYSWSFTIDTSPPVASNPIPANGSYVNTTLPTINVTLTDALSGVNPSTIQMTVEGILVSHNYIGTTVTWTATSPYSDGQVINVTLNAADNIGNAMVQYEWYFTIDVSPPVASNEEPTGIISDDRPLIRVKLEDTLSGINFSATQMLLNGSAVSYGYDGENLTYTPPSPLANAIYNVTITSQDNVGNQMVPYQWTFQVFVTVPYAYNPNPANNSYTNAPTPLVEVYLDAYWDVDSTTIRTWLNGSLVSHTWSAVLHRVRYTVPGPYNHGDIINATVQCNDTMGNQMDPYTWFFTIDLVNPFGSNEFPNNNSIINNANPTISLDLTDSLSGINATTISMQVEGSPVATTWDGTTVSYSGGSFSDGQVVDVSVTASDNAGNTMSAYTWSFTVDLSPPSASNPSPANNSYTSDSTPTITVDLADSLSGVNASSITLTVEGNTVSYSWDGSTVSYTPTTPFNDGQIINVDLDASDNAGNAMATYSWSFTIDLTAPTINILVNTTYKNSTSFYITINVTTSEQLNSLNLNVTSPTAIPENVPMTEILPNFWQGIYNVKINGSYTVDAIGTDFAGNSGVDSDSFIVFITDLTPPNFIGVITVPTNLVYNESNRPTNWTGYPYSAGYNVNITAQFNETSGAYPIVEVKIYYKLSTQPGWIIGLMVQIKNESTGGGLYRLFSYSFIMPALENGTIVSINIIAKDGANNVFTLNSSGYNLEYTSMGNWIKTIDILNLIAPGVPFGTQFTLVANVSLRNSSFLVEINARLHDPRKDIMEPLIPSNYTLYNNTMTITGGQYQWTYPYIENVSYGLEIFAQIWILDNNTGKPVSFTYDGTIYSNMSQFVYLGKITDNEAPNISALMLSTISPKSTDDIEIRFTLEKERSGASRIDSVIVYYRVNGGTFTSITPVVYNGEYSAVIPRQSANSIIEYYIEIRDEAGNIYRSNIGTLTVQNEDIGSYLLFGIILGTVVLGLVIAIMQNKSRVKKATGKERYKYIKKSVGGK
ncbi:MAG: hypothetical protein ACTSXT_08580, partial [Candidatus Helarchaeota archaeon]